MKLKKYDTTNCIPMTGAGRQSKNAVAITKGGVFKFYAGAVEKTGLKPDDKIAIFHDEENPDDWYICKDDKGFNLRLTDPTKTTNALKTNNASVARLIFEQFEFPEDKTVTILMAGTPQKIEKKDYWCILTSSATWAGKI